MSDQYGVFAVEDEEDFNVWPAVTDSILLMISLFMVYLVLSVHLRPTLAPRPEPTPVPSERPLIMTRIPLKESVLFESGIAEPRPEGVKAVMDRLRTDVPQRIARLRKGFPQHVVILEVAGHADIRPTEGGSNWSLSTERANSVVLAIEGALMAEPDLARRLGIDLSPAGRNPRPGATLLKAAGYSQYQPKELYPQGYLMTPDDDVVLRENRRIEIRLYVQPSLDAGHAD